ncbi:MAG: hypothetical protein LC768_03305 [Acidobacteria bacterium]|nr:hypothetical protein [Acidobacteriota bacterium]MCA1637355.1 hypothetical protein [Acidobacteriota bacterium]
MKILELNNDRFKVALELFEEGKSFNFYDVDFCLNKENKILEVRTFTNWELRNLTEQNALNEIQHGKEVLNCLLTQSTQFRETTQNYQSRFSVIQNLGNGIVEICYL